MDIDMCVFSSRLMPVGESENQTIRTFSTRTSAHMRWICVQKHTRPRSNRIQQRQRNTHQHSHTHWHRHRRRRNDGFMACASPNRSRASSRALRDYERMHFARPKNNGRDVRRARLESANVRCTIDTASEGVTSWVSRSRSLSLTDPQFCTAHRCRIGVLCPCSFAFRSVTWNNYEPPFRLHSACILRIKMLIACEK